MKNFDPRTKLITVACITTLGVVLKNPLYLLGVLVATIIIDYALGANPLVVARKIKRLIPMLFAIAILQSVFIKEGNAFIKIGQFQVLTTVGIKMGLNFILRISIMMTSAIILSTSSSRDMVQGLICMKVPYTFAFMVSLGIRFMPVLMEELQDTITAIKIKGIQTDKLKAKEKIKLYSTIFMPVVVNTLVRAKKLALSVELRGFRVYTKRTSIRTLKLKAKDYIAMATSLAVLIIILI